MPAIEPPVEALIASAASFVFISLLFALVLLLCRRRRRAKPLAGSLPYSVSGAGDYESASFDLSLGHISMAELAAATGNFSPDAIVGDGAFGFVYRARFSSGLVVAVKRLSADAVPSQGLREFRAEMETLGRLRHPNLARLLGFCASGPADRLLIYEFLTNGALDQWLYPTTGEGWPAPATLSWPARVKIVRGVAAGLAFLHEECRPRIIHRDIKSSNVLLDAELEAKVTDFGLARRVDGSRSHVSTQVAGTMGYMPPEYQAGATAATAAADVYSFGVLMLEVAAGRRPNLPLRREEDGREEGMERWARRAVEEGRGMEILDPRMEIGGLKEEEVDGYLHVALRCTEEGPRRRPTMADVVSLLYQLQKQLVS